MQCNIFSWLYSITSRYVLCNFHSFCFICFFSPINGSFVSIFSSTVCSPCSLCNVSSKRLYPVLWITPSDRSSPMSLSILAQNPLLRMSLLLSLTYMILRLIPYKKSNKYQLVNATNYLVCTFITYTLQFRLWVEGTLYFQRRRLLYDGTGGEQQRCLNLIYCFSTI